MTLHGFKNNYHHKVLAGYVPLKTEETYALLHRFDYLSYIRVCQAYRNISRKCKQYFYGDKELEQAFIVFFQANFMQPVRGETPIDLIKYGGARRLADQIERDWELVSYNQHPYMMYVYNEKNHDLSEKAEYNAQLAQGDKPMEVQLAEVLGSKLSEAKESKGGKLDMQECHKIFEEVYSIYKSALVGAQRGMDGEYKDFLEQKRPFVDSNGHVKTD